MLGCAVAMSALASACGRIGFAGDDTVATSDGRIPDGTPAATYAAAVNTDTPAAYFHFDEDAGDPCVSVGGAISAPYQGSFGYATAGAMGGSRSVTFDGSTARVDLGDRFPFAGTSAFTI